MVFKVFLYCGMIVLCIRIYFLKKCLQEHKSVYEISRVPTQLRLINVCYRNSSLHLDTLLPHVEYTELECFTDCFNELSVGSNGGRKLGAGAFGSVSILYWLGVGVCVCIAIYVNICVEMNNCRCSCSPLNTTWRATAWKPEA